MPQTELLHRKLERALKARKEAERILEEKALELFKANLDLRSLNESLETQVFERTKELEKSKIIAEEAQAAEASFLANMSHEIRTPLNAIVGMTHLLKDTPLDTEQKELVGVLENSSRILLGLISDILDLSKIDSGNIDIQEDEIDLPALLSPMINGLKNRSKEKNLEITLSLDKQIDTYLISDELLLNQILFNLIGNAFKFTEKGYINISVTQLEKTIDKRHILFSVKDSGIGIKKEDLELIFQQFKQVSSQIKHKYSGTGLGLAIIQKLIKLLHGHIEVDSNYGTGSEFRFKLWLKDSGRKLAEKKPETQEIIDFSDYQETILVVEDNPINQLYITKLLKKWNVKHHVANHGKEAVDMVQNKNYALILMDLQMPVMDGMEATKCIRKLHTAASKAPIIALTASTLLTKKQMALSIGMNDFLSKPFVPKDLYKMLRKHLNFEKPHVVEQQIETQMGTETGLDDSYLYSIYEDDLEYMKDIFEIFLSSIDGSIKDIKTHFESKDLVQMQAEVHKLKPSFAMVGLPDITDQMQQLENLIGTSATLELIGESMHKVLMAYRLSDPYVKDKLATLNH